MTRMIASKLGPGAEIAVYGTTDGLRIGHGAQVDFDQVISDQPHTTLRDALGPHAALFTPAASVGTMAAPAIIDSDAPDAGAQPSQDDKE